MTGDEAQADTTAEAAGAAVGLLLVLSGPSGVGKTSIARALRERVPGAAFSVSVTTRTKTAADTEAVDYYFVDDAAFDGMVANHELLEWARVYDKRYGTPRAPVIAELDAGRVVMLDIDVEGARQVRRAMPETLAVFVLPPSDEALLRRLRDRGRDDASAIQKRFAAAQAEIAAARASGVYDAFLVNDDLERAIGEAEGLVAARRGAGPGPLTRRPPRTPGA